MKNYFRLLKNITRYFLFILFTYTNHTAASLHESSSRLTAVIKNPIAEMSVNFKSFDNSPASPEIKSCPRAHQGLYNELVNREEEDGDFTKISYNNIIYGFDPATQQPLNSFWAHKKHLALLSELTQEIVAVIPNPHYAQEPTIVLLYPWQKFSVGTRFKHLAKYDVPNFYAIARPDYTTNSVVAEFVPHEWAMQEVQQDSQAARKLFVTIINNLVDRVAAAGSENVIPYVWGGSSFVEPYTRSEFYQEDGAWQRTGPSSFHFDVTSCRLNEDLITSKPTATTEGQRDPYSGYDCSEFVMRMAQIAGIEFPWKTTKAIQLGRRELSDNDQLQEGDLIWLPGHVMIVSNLERNEIIEARGYTSGYGCVHRAPLSECFEDIATYDDLLEYHHANKSVRLKDMHGEIQDKHYAVKLLKLVD